MNKGFSFIMVGEIIVCLGSQIMVGVGREIWPIAYNIIISILVSIPILCILGPSLLSKVVNLFMKKDNLEKDLSVIGFVGFIVPLVWINLHGFVDNYIVDWNAYWVPFVFLAATTLAMFLIFYPFFRGVRFLLILPIVFSIAYSSGATLILNGLLDRSLPVNYQTKVINYQITHLSRGGQGCNAILLPCGPMKEGKISGVGWNFKDRHPIGSNVTVTVKRGFFNIPWYMVNW